MLHPSLESSLAQLPVDRHVMLLTRHSLREMTRDPNGVAGYELPLTPEGVALAETWGQRLTRPIEAFYSSPVGRCVDTATAMARGAGLVLPVQTTTVLVEPGCYVENARNIGPLFLQMGPLAFANHHLQLQEPVKGLLTAKQGASKLLQHLYQSQGQAGTFSIHVTHDTILAAFIYHLLGRDELLDADWPWMMEGVWLWFDEQHIYWLWRGEQGQCPQAHYLFETNTL